MDIRNLKDEEIISRIKEEGSSRCFEVLYYRYHEKVRGKCHSFVKNREMAEELAENIFIRAFEKLPSLKQLSSFSSWLYSITYNQCIDYLREKKKLHYPEWNRVNEMPEIIDETEEIIQDINYENLYAILEVIHPEEKALLLMKYQDALSMKQISAALRISENAAKMRLKRARTRVLLLYAEKYFRK
ncbi:MAG: RNA polymerase sigma factor [Bacteroidales bacterium]|nr:RNA polymerase sigma factor [Bacteroidales bacterium]